MGPAIADQYIILDRVPAIYLGMLGVHTPMDRQGIGTKLLMDAVQRAMAIAENAGVWALTLDATDEETVAYYERFDFERLAPDRLEMYLPISLIKRTFQMEADALVQEDETEAAA